MDLSDPQDRRRWLDHLSGLVAGRKVVCGVAPLAALTEFVEMFARAGAEKPLLLYTSRGAGPVPGEEDAQLLQVETPRYATLSEEVRDQERGAALGVGGRARGARRVRPAPGGAAGGGTVREHRSRGRACRGRRP